jgi:hypothetical protein
MLDAAAHDLTCGTRYGVAAQVGGELPFENAQKPQRK